MGSEEARAILAVASAPPPKTAAHGFSLAGFGGPWYLGRRVSAVGALILKGICGALTLVGVGLVLLPALWVIDAIAVATKSSTLRSLALLHSDPRG